MTSFYFCGLTLNYDITVIVQIIRQNYLIRHMFWQIDLNYSFFCIGITVAWTFAECERRHPPPLTFSKGPCKSSCYMTNYFKQLKNILFVELNNFVELSVRLQYKWSVVRVLFSCCECLNFWHLYLSLARLNSSSSRAHVCTSYPTSACVTFISTREWNLRRHISITTLLTTGLVTIIAIKTIIHNYHFHSHFHSHFNNYFHSILTGYISKFIPWWMTKRIVPYTSIMHGILYYVSGGTPLLTYCKVPCKITLYVNQNH